MDSEDKEISRRDFLAWAAAIAAMAALPGCIPSSSGPEYAEAPAATRTLSTQAYASESLPTYVSVIDLNHPIIVPDPPPAIVINSGSGQTEHYLSSPATASVNSGKPYVHDLSPGNLAPVPWDGGQATPLAQATTNPVVTAPAAYQVQAVQPIQMLQPEPAVAVGTAVYTQAQPIQAMQVQGQLQTTSVNLDSRAPSLSARAPVASPPGKVQVVSRNSWSAVAANPSRMRAMNGVRRITIHHEGSAKPNNDRNAGQVIETLRLIQGQHRKRMGAGDIGYHFIIDRTGLIWQGRDWAFQGAHSSGANANNLGVMLLGNFEIQQPTQAQLASLHSLTASLVRKYGLDPRTDIFGHADFCNTQCPGKHLRPQVAVLRRMR